MARRPRPPEPAAGRGARRSGRTDAGALLSALPETVTTTTGSVRLVRDPDRRAVTVEVNGVPSSYVDLDDPGHLAFEYMQHMAAVVDATWPAGRPLDVVHLGAAGCSLARWVHAERPGSRQVAVDLDAALLEHVRQWFDLPRSPALRLRPGDALAVLETLAPASADVVVRDVFAGDVTPTHLTTLEFVAQVLRVLRPGGLYLVNCADRPPLRRARAEAATLLAVPGADVALVAEPAVLKGRRYGNLVLALRAPSPAPDATGQKSTGQKSTGQDSTGQDATGQDATGHQGPRDGGLARSGLERSLRALAVPATLVTGTALRDLVAGATPITSAGSSSVAADAGP